MATDSQARTAEKIINVTLFKMIWPTASHDLSQGFTGKQAHGGIDILEPCGGDISAPEDATSCDEKTASGYGYYLDLGHGSLYVELESQQYTDYRKDAVTTRYAHLPSTRQSPQTPIAQGTIIAEVGHSGNTTTCCHLHFETLEDSNRVDPLIYLP